MQNLKALLERLLQSQVDFVLIGGFAGVVHGSTSVTQDLDICAAMTDENIGFLREALIDLHPEHRMNPNFKPSFLDHPKDLGGWNHLYLKTDLGILDVLSEVPPVGTFADIKARATELSLYGHKCKVISIDDLIQIKESMSRPKDLQVLADLKAIRSKKRS